MYVRACACAHACECMRMFVCVYVCAPARACVCVCVCVRKCVCERESVHKQRLTASHIRNALMGSFDSSSYRHLLRVDGALSKFCVFIFCV